MKKYSYIDRLIVLFLAGIIFFTYKGLFQTFFQQDEWLTLGSVFGGGIFAELSHYSLLQVLAGAGRPLGSIINYIIFLYFPFQTDILVWFALCVHILNSIAVYVLVVLCTRKRMVACMSALFFAINITASQSVSWFASIFTTLPAATSIFLSMIVFYWYLKAKKNAYLIASQIFCIVAYLFKESSIFLFFLLPLIDLARNNWRFSIPGLVKRYLLFIAYACMVIIARIYSIQGLGQAAGSFVSNSTFMWQKMIMHILLYPVISLPQIFIPEPFMYTLSGWFQKINYGGIPGFVSTQLGVESVVSDFVSFLIAVCMIIGLYITGKGRKKFDTFLFWGILFTMASFMPYAILDKKSAYLDSRYFYVGSAGGGFILALIFDRIFTFFRGKNKIFYAVFCLICMMLFFGYIYKNYQWITRDVQRMILVAKERKSVLLSIRKLTPSGIEKPVYYITGNNFGYYGIPEVKVPFQQGFGYTLMVWNFSSGKIPLRLLRETFLWRIREEGYKEEGQKGFGYFYNLNTLKFYIEKGAVAPSQVIGLYYDCDKKILRDVTFETREALESSL